MWAADVTLVWDEVEVPAEGETGIGARRGGFLGVDGWGVVVMGGALASGVEDLPDTLGCRDEPWL